MRLLFQHCDIEANIESLAHQQNGSSRQEGSISIEDLDLNIDMVSVITMVTQLEYVTLDPINVPTQPHHHERGPR